MDFQKELVQMIACADLIELEKKYGNRNELISQYESASINYPDRKLMTETWINDWISSMVKRKRELTYHFDGKPVFDHLAFVAIGYDRMIRGIIQNNFDELIYVHAEIMVQLVKRDQLPSLRYTCMKNLACGASIALFISFLKDQLNNKSKKLSSNIDQNIPGLSTLFISSAHFKRAVDFLREQDIIADDNSFISEGNTKSQIGYWFKILNNQGIIDKKDLSLDIVANVLENHFNGLKIDPRALTRPDIKTKTDFTSTLAEKLPYIIGKK